MRSRPWTAKYTEDSLAIDIAELLLPRSLWFSHDRFIPSHPAGLLTRLGLIHSQLCASFVRYIPDISQKRISHQDNPQTASLTHVLFTFPTLNHK